MGLLFLASFHVSHAQGDGEALQLYAKAENYRKSKNFIKAIDEYNKAIHLQPNNGRFHFSKGISYFLLKDYDNAILACEKTIHLKSDFTPAYLMIARCYQGLERELKVMQYLDLAYKYEQDVLKRLDYKKKILKILLKRNDLASGARHIQEAKLLAPKDVEVLYFEAKLANEQKNYQKTVNAIETAIKYLGKYNLQAHARYYYELGYAYNKLGKYDYSRNAFDKAKYGPFKVKIAKLSPQYYLGIAYSYLKINDFSNSKKYVMTALEMQHNFAQAYVLMGNIYKREADQSQAIQQFKKALKVEEEEKSKAAILKNLAQLQLDNAQYPEAITLSQEYIKTEPKDYSVYFIKGIAEYKNKDYQAAIATFEHLTGFTGLDPETQAKYNFAMGIIYKEVNDLNLAKEAFKKAKNGPYKSVAEIEYEKIENAEELATQ
ncbi:tetratricopeptide repeat protein [Rapidithrix thailandica]|uniref:Tetratricopeptide repeat protein n=1 Tax=Rapidithrix thailandica TaxID=413964 RepID=A0AAW9RRA8_9BACT